MKEWFFFYRIGMFGNDLAIDQAIEAPVSIFADPTETTAVVGDGTKMVTQQTIDSTLLSFLVKPGFLHKV